ncbi:MAG: excinuclease ABC subunit UvrA [Deltaproteobacteria bacterium]|nr:excinuclease ABC subunit UvrA [Deltaproteobacteria bacterium]
MIIAQSSKTPVKATGYVDDISVTGMGIITPTYNSFEIGDVIEAHFELPLNNREKVKKRCVVVCSVRKILKQSVMFVKLRGIRQHNLKNLNLDIPLYKLIGLCGVSGSGKSSLAFHVLHAEGQRRYLETFSPYLRQFFEQLSPPDADIIENIPPTIALESGTTVQNARSTVGTLTEINDLLKHLYAQLSEPYCPFCNREIRPSTPETVLNTLKQCEKDRFYLLAPIRLSTPRIREELARIGYIRVFYSRRIWHLDDPDFPNIKEDPLWVVVDRIDRKKASEERIRDSLHQAFSIGNGKIKMLFPDGSEQEFCNLRICPGCGAEIPEKNPEVFSFNSPVGACSECRGFGRIIDIDLNMVIPDQTKSILEGAIKPWTPGRSEYYDLLRFCKSEGIPVDVPFERLKPEQQDKIINGTDRFYGIRGFFGWLEQKTYKTHVRVFLSRYRAYRPCPACGGTRYGKAAQFFRLQGKPIYEVQSWSAERCYEFFKVIFETIPDHCRSLTEEIIKRLKIMVDLRLGYLSLDRPSRTLSSGEVQRVHFVKVLGSSLSNVLYILDEPSVGLHPRDQENLIVALRKFVTNHNTVVLVDHDPEILKICDELIELGPGGGNDGGYIVAKGPPDKVSSTPESPTAPYLKNPLQLPDERKDSAQKGKPKTIRIIGAKAFNLKNITVEIPLGRVVGVSGVSGAGKTSLVETTLYGQWKLFKKLPLDFPPGPCEAVEGLEQLEDVILIDRRPIGKSPRANLLTYSGVLTHIRQLLASTPEAKLKGLSARHFSFNQPGGRCEVCRGEGFERFDMQFLADIYAPCPACKGKRFKKEILDVRYMGWSIEDFLNATAADVLRAFPENKYFGRSLRPFVDLNLDKIKLGQPLSTLSAGELQRLKLVPFLQKSERRAGSGDGFLIILDEPSRGLHPRDLKMLIELFRNIAQKGNTVIIVEHNPLVLVNCEWIIDLGPEGGDRGGHIVFEGTVQDLLECKESITGRYLRKRVESLTPSPCTPSMHKESKTETPSVMLRGVRHNNLKIEVLSIPFNRVITVTGVSGSGKSSLAFDVLHSEGTRRYLECLSTYVKQFFTIFEKPDVDFITALPPTVAIEQKLSRAVGKSTVGTITGIYHYIRLLFSRAGTQRCLGCGQPVRPLSVDVILNTLNELARQEPITISAPVVYRRKGVYKDLIKRLGRMGFNEIFVDGVRIPKGHVPELSRFEDHTIEATRRISRKITDDDVLWITRALNMGAGFITVTGLESGKRTILSTKMYCPWCNIGYLPLDPRLFSFNSPYGACCECSGKGIKKVLQTEKLRQLMLRNKQEFLQKWIGATFIPQKIRKEWKKVLLDLKESGKKLMDFDPDKFLEGTRALPGLIPVLEQLLVHGKLPEDVVAELAEMTCPACGGTRINEQARAVEFAGYTVPDLTAMTVEEAIDTWKTMKVPDDSRLIFERIRSEVLLRLGFLAKVGLEYLTLDRSGDTLSGGEYQRVRLAAALGSHLHGVFYILDEPTIGLHPSDNEKVIKALHHLKKFGNTVLVVEHDADTIRKSDFIIELGPGAGAKGGRIVACGTVKDFEEKSETSTYAAIVNSPKLNLEHTHAQFSKWIEFRNVRFRNLKSITVRIPLNALVTITGVSGSGKSTLLFDVIYPYIAFHTGQKKWFLPNAERCESIHGVEELSAVHKVDHQPIGRTPRSTPATYLGIWNEVRTLFASLPEAKATAMTTTHFSFNLSDGRCPFCKGLGVIVEKMSFLPEVSRTCPACGGHRYQKHVLSVKYKGKSIADVLNMTFDEAESFFAHLPRIARVIRFVNELGLGYLKLGQPSPTLSGGEAQRIKLARELVKNAKPSMFVLDEPTTGLHRLDVEKLVKSLRQLVNKGHTVVAIEHNLDFIGSSDYVIDLGPGSGEKGGRIVAEGSPLDIRGFAKTSATARALSGHERRGVCPQKDYTSL